MQKHCSQYAGMSMVSLIFYLNVLPLTSSCSVLIVKQLCSFKFYEARHDQNCVFFCVIVFFEIVFLGKTSVSLTCFCFSCATHCFLTSFETASFATTVPRMLVFAPFELEMV